MLRSHNLHKTKTKKNTPFSQDDECPDKDAVKYRHVLGADDGEHGQNKQRCAGKSIAVEARVAETRNYRQGSWELTGGNPTW